jgi:hypothetical protein
VAAARFTEPGAWALGAADVDGAHVGLRDAIQLGVGVLRFDAADAPHGVGAGAQLLPVCANARATDGAGGERRLAGVAQAGAETTGTAGILGGRSRPRPGRGAVV